METVKDKGGDSKSVRGLARQEFTKEDNDRFLRAALQSDLNIVRAYMDKGMHPDDARDEQGNTALILTAGKMRWIVDYDDNLEVVDLLLERGADIEMRNNNEETALLRAAAVGSRENIVFFAEKGADKTALNKNHEDMFTLAGPALAKELRTYFSLRETLTIEEIAHISNPQTL